LLQGESFARNCDFLFIDNRVDIEFPLDETIDFERRSTNQGSLMIHSDRDSLDSMIDGSRILALICYCLAMALPAQNTIRTTYGIEAFVFSLAAAVYFAHSNEMRLLLWSGYLNICIICLVGSWLWRSSTTRLLETIVVTVLTVSIINVACLTERSHAIGFYLWFFSSILFAFSTLLRLWFTFVQEEPLSDDRSKD
jgi:hypothetical protein